MTVPSAEDIEQAAHRLTQLRDAIRESAAANKILVAAEQELGAETIRLTELEAQQTEILGELQDNMAGWIAGAATPGTVFVPLAPNHQKTVIELDEAIRLMALYVETTSTERTS